MPSMQASVSQGQWEKNKITTFENEQGDLWNTSEIQTSSWIVRGKYGFEFFLRKMRIKLTKRPSMLGGIIYDKTASVPRPRFSRFENWVLGGQTLSVLEQWQFWQGSLCSTEKSQEESLEFPPTMEKGKKHDKKNPDEVDRIELHLNSELLENRCD